MSNTASQAWEQVESVIRGGFNDDHEGDFGRAYEFARQAGKVAGQGAGVFMEVAAQLQNLSGKTLDHNAVYRPGTILGVVAAVSEMQANGGEA
ncbi:MAG TPA: hypothetical protein VLE99_04635 [Candidatus Saccharimonadales bacterium]|nr:hypothetical protein [Candidatus Saccharimonadales bacterium]